MSLDFDYSRVAHKDILTTHPDNPDEYHPVFYALIWTLYAVGIREITDKNVDKVYQRVALWARVTDAPMRRKAEDGSTEQIYFTGRDIKAYVGLRLNIRNIPATEFLQRVDNAIGTYKHRGINVDFQSALERCGLFEETINTTKE